MDNERPGRDWPNLVGRRDVELGPRGRLAFGRDIAGCRVTRHWLRLPIGWPPQKSRTAVARLKGWKIIQGGLVMGKTLTSLVFGAAVLALASSEASAMNFLCQAVGARSVGYGRAFFAADAKWQALLRCERRSGICIISYCVPTY